MSVRQRLRIKFNIREAERVCWHCTIAHRYTSTTSRVSSQRTAREGLDGFAALTHDIRQRLIRNKLTLEAFNEGRLQKLQIRRPESRARKQRPENQQLGSISKIRRRDSKRQPHLTKQDPHFGFDSQKTRRKASALPDGTWQANVKTASFAYPPLARRDNIATSVQTEKDATDHGLDDRPCAASKVEEGSQLTLAQNVHRLPSVNVRPRVSFHVRRRAFRYSSVRNQRRIPRALETLQDRTNASTVEASSSRNLAMQAHSRARSEMTEKSAVNLRKHAVHSKRIVFRKFPVLEGGRPVDNGTISRPDVDETRSLEKASICQTDEASSPSHHLSKITRIARAPSQIDTVLYPELDLMLDTYRNLPSTRMETSTVSTTRSYNKANGFQESSSRRAASIYYRNMPLTKNLGSMRLFGNMSIPKYTTRSASTFTQIAVPGCLPARSSDTMDITKTTKFDGGTIRERLESWRKYQGNNSSEPLTSIPFRNQLGAAEYIHDMATQSNEIKIQNDVLREDENETDHQELDFQGDTFELTSNQSVYLRRGDMVEFRTSHEPILAIFVRNLSDQSQFYTEQGQWLHRQSTKVQFAVPDFVSAEELEDIVPFLPSEDIASEAIDQLQPIHISAPRDAGAVAVAKMQSFRLASDNVFRQHADTLSRAYETMAPREDSSGPRFIPLETVAKQVLQKAASKLSPAMLWAVHRTLCRAQNVVPDGRSHRLNPKFEFLPVAKLNDIESVRDWAREYQESVVEGVNEMSDDNVLGEPTANPIRSFAKKARRIVKQSRESRRLSPTGGVGPSLRTEELRSPNMPTWSLRTNEKLTSEEKKIIRYMDAWVASRYLTADSNLEAIGPMILRAVDMYGSLALDERIGFTFLQELGILTPWENRSVYRTGTRLPGHDVYHPTTILHDQARQSLSDFEFKDSMVGMRRDWGDLAVFCIDSADTLERDDGISLQSVIDDPSLHWIHVHVANPSAFIAPDSAVGRYAANLAQSVYLPEYKYSMLEPLLSKAYFSLGKDRPCITFSAKVNVKGEILQKEISHGIIHNVHYVTHERISNALELGFANSSNSPPILVVGNHVPEAETRETQTENDRPFSAAEVEAIRKLRELGKATRYRRERESGLISRGGQTETKRAHPEVYLSKQPASFEKNLTGHFGHYTGDPVISIKTTTHASEVVSDMVADLMVLAGEVAAQWSKERNLPVPYRGITRNPEPCKSPEAFKSEVIQPHIERYGQVNIADLISFMKLLGTSIYSAAPLEHPALGLPAYCKVTSPLRRYVDLFTHWQIEAVLRHESLTDDGFAIEDNAAYLAFDQAQVEAVSKEMTSREHSIRFLQLSSQRHWICQALFRAFYFKEALLPEVFEVVVSHLGVRGSVSPSAWLDGWGRVVSMLDLPVSHPQGGYKIGDRWRAKISSIDPYYSRVNMEPVMLLSRDSQP